MVCGSGRVRSISTRSVTSSDVMVFFSCAGQDVAAGIDVGSRLDEQDDADQDENAYKDAE